MVPASSFSPSIVAYSLEFLESLRARVFGRFNMILLLLQLIFKTSEVPLLRLSMCDDSSLGGRVREMD